ncbi:MAG: hypothetical protein ACRDPY_12915 [Streptosporangiaceae bacterium]
MAIVVLVLWMFTAGAGIYLLVTSNLGRARPATADLEHNNLAPQMASAAVPAAGPSLATASDASAPPAAAVPAATGTAATGTAAAGTAGADPAKSARAARREARRAARNRWDPPSLTASKTAPLMPHFRSLMEFLHPAFGIIGLAFWLGYTLIHSRPLAWIAFGLVAVTACAGLAWFAANVRAKADAARRRDPAEPPPSFNGRLIALHGTAAAVTLTLAALTALIARG